MSGSIDQRIVDMQFNNQQFESGIKTSLSSIDKLKSGLNLDTAAKSLSGLNTAGQNFSLAGIANGVETIASRFSALGMIGVTALVNIANQAINTGKQMLSSLTIDPVKAGFGSYETKVNAIKTVMSGTGETIEEVTKSLDELNTYSDRTVYSFEDMTANISKFTNAGLSSKEAATAIQGISNVAAISGANAGEAARAMYNFGQALSQGSVRLMDWKSIENANMATVGFKNQLLDSAVAAGTLTKSADGMYKTLEGTPVSATKGFNESLEKQWMTVEVLNKTLGDYASSETDIGKKANAAAQDVLTFTQMLATMKDSVKTGWTKSWSAIIGDNVQATKLFTDINNAFGSMVGPSIKARNEMLQFWNANGGRDAIIEGITSALTSLSSILKPIGDAFREIFPAMTGERLVTISKAFRDFMNKLKPGEETIDKIKRAFKGLFAFLDIAKQFFSAIAKGAKLILVKLLPAGDGLLTFSAKIGDWLVALNESIKTSGIFTKAVDNIAIAIDWVAEKIKVGVDFILPFLEKIRSKFAEFFASFKKIDLSGVSDMNDQFRERMQPLTGIAKFVAKVFEKLANVFKKLAPIFLTLGTALSNIFLKIGTKIKEAFGEAGFDSLKDVINTGFLAVIVAGISKFMKSLSSVTDGAGGFLKGLTGILDGVKGSLQAYQDSIKAGTILKIAIAIGILALSLIALSMIDSNKLTIAMAAITSLFVELMASMALLQSGGKGTKMRGMMGITASMIAISVAILILSVAMKKLSEIDAKGLTKGTIAIGILMGFLVTVSKTLSSKSKTIVKGMGSLLLFSAAILILTSAVKKLGALSLKELGKGLIAVGILMAELAIFMKVIDKSKMNAGSGVGLVLMAVAINLLATAVQAFGNLSVNQLIKGLGAMAIVLAELALFMRVSGDAKKVLATAASLVIIASAMGIFASVIEKMGNLSIKQLAKGLGAMAVSLGLVTLALRLMPANTLLKGLGLLAIAGALSILADVMVQLGGMSLKQIGKSLIALAGSMAIIVVAMKLMTTALPGAAALLIISVALTILANVMKTLGGMSLEEIGLALLALVGVFAVLGVAGLVLGPLVPVLIGLGIAITLLGVAVLAIGAGLLLFSMGLAALAVSGSAGAAALVLIVTSLLSLIPYALQMLAEGIIAFAVVIGESAPVLLDALTKLLMALLASIDEVAPKAIESFMLLLKGILKALVEAVPELVDAGMKILLGFLRGIANNIQAVVEAGFDIVIGIMKGITTKLPLIIDAGFKMLISFLDGLAEAIRTNSDKIFAAAGNLLSAIGEAIVKQLGQLVKVGEDIINGIINGVKDMATKLKDAVVKVAKDAWNALLKFLGIASPSKLFATAGTNMGKGLAVGLEGQTKDIANQATELGKTAIDSLTKSMSNISDVLTADMDTSPVIRPVLDLTDITSGSKTLNSMLPKSASINVAASNNAAMAVAQSQKANADAKAAQDLANGLSELNGALKELSDSEKEPIQQNNFNGTYTFGNREDIDYFMNQAALITQRRKS